MADLPGYVPELEQEVIGALLSGGDHKVVLAMLEPRHFVEAVHARVYECIRVAHERYSSTSLPTVVRLIPSDLAASFEAAAGIALNAYLARCMAETVYGAGTLLQGAKNVIAQRARIAVGEEAQRLVAASGDFASDPVALVREAGAAFDDIMADVRIGSRRRNRVQLGDATAAALVASREARSTRGLTGITSGLRDLDYQTGGFQRRDLTLIAARPSMGKTTIGTSIAIRAAGSGSGVAFFSLEMDAEKLAMRCATDIAYDWGVKVPYADLIRGTASESDLQAVASAVQDFDALPLWIEDQAGLSLTDIRIKLETSMAEMERRGSRLDMAIMDHLGLIRPSSRYLGNRVNEIGELTSGLKSMAREYDIAMLLLSQLNREVDKRDNKRPILADLRDSGAIEQDADAVMFLYREAYYLQQEKPTTATRIVEREADLAACRNLAELHIAKQRNGAVTTVNLFADMAYSVFRNLAHGGGR